MERSPGSRCRLQVRFDSHLPAWKIAFCAWRIQRCGNERPSPDQEEKPLESRPPLPPFTAETARQKVQAAEDEWNSLDPERVSLAYTPDSDWRNRDEFFTGRAAIKEFLTRGNASTMTGNCQNRPVSVGVSILRRDGEPIVNNAISLLPRFIRLRAQARYGGSYPSGGSRWETVKAQKQ